MVSMRELDSFVAKFKNLLHNGFEATLSMESKSGKAFVILKAGLDPVSAPTRTSVSHFSPSRICGIPNRYRSPSYRRRQERRRMARENSDHIVAEKANNVEEKVMSSLDSPECHAVKVADTQAEICLHQKHSL